MKACIRSRCVVALLGLVAAVNVSAQTTITAGTATFQRPAASAFDASPSANFTGVGTGDYVFEMGWWFRIGGATQESFFPVPSSITAAGNTSTITWNDPAGNGAFSATEVATISSAAANTGTVRLDMTITNSSAVNPLTIEVFNFLDQDANGSAGTDSVVQPIPGVPLLRVTDATVGFSEYIGVAANAFLARPFSATTDVAALLSDTLVTNFDNSGVPASNLDVTAGMQWSLVIAPGGSRTVTVFFTGNVGVPPGNLTITPPSVAFGNQVVGTTSPASTVTLANTGSLALIVSELTPAAAPFARAGGTCATTLPITIAAGANCTLTYTFAPTAAGAANQTLTVTATFAGSGTIDLSGTGTQGSLSITPPSIAFGNQAIGTTSPASTVTLANTGSASLDVTALTAATAPFARAGGTCATTLPITLAAGANCTLTYTFAPTAAGATNQTLTVTANGPGSGTIALSGTGTQGNLTITPTTVPFGNQTVGTTSPATTVTLANTGSASLDVTALTAATAPFARAGGTCATTLPITLAAGANCTLTYTFAPTAAGATNQTLTVTANGPGSGTIALSGTGVTAVPVLSTLTLDFLQQPPGSISTLPVTLSNTGAGVLTVNSISAVTAPFALSASSTCATAPFTLAAGGSCTLVYSFSPASAGQFTGTVDIATGSGALTLQLRGASASVTPIPALHPAATLLMLLVLLSVGMVAVRRRG